MKVDFKSNTSSALQSARELYPNSHHSAKCNSAEPTRLLRLTEVLQLIPVSKSTWWAWCASGKAPKPIKLSEKTTCWRLSDILAFIDQHSNQGVA